MSKTAGIVVIGNEILSGRTQDENTPYLLAELRDLGVAVRRVAVIPDELEAIRDAVREFAEGLDYVFTSGGVGPTHDDVTIAGIAAAFGRGIERSPELESILRGYYQESVTEATLRMADVPEGAELVTRGRMLFPVIAVDNVYIFPGVPEILAAKFRGVREMFRQDPYFVLDTFLRAEESEIAHVLQSVLDRFPDVSLGSYPTFSNPNYTVKLSLESKDKSYLDEAHAFMLERLDKELSIQPL